MRQYARKGELFTTFGEPTKPAVCWSESSVVVVKHPTQRPKMTYSYVISLLTRGDTLYCISLRSGFTVNLVFVCILCANG